MNLDSLEKKTAHYHYLLARLEKIQTLGNEAISSYDLLMGYDAEFYLQPDSVLNNQIKSLERQIFNDKNYKPRFVQLLLLEELK